ncbi:MAG: ATP-binding protein [Candidatus Aminicenantes bacterium]|nr:ATP-binding protein [Candidatus Aminicenantes bacterium]
MVFKKFRIQCIFRILFLTATIFLFIFLIFRSSLYSAIFILGLAIIYQCYSLIHYIEKTNRELSRFFESIKYEDFSQTFKNKSLGSSFSALENAFKDVLDVFRKTRTEKEEHYQYLQTIVQHVAIGLIAFFPDGEVELINTAAKRLLDISQLKNIKNLEGFSKPLVKTLMNLKPKENALVKVEDKSEVLHLALYATEFKLRSNTYKLVSLQNIQSELEETEIEAWQKLIRVLTHEIMNSITPISSLASTISGLIKTNIYTRSKTPNTEFLNDIEQALHTIKKRSQGLLHFVNAYRNLTIIPKPNFQMFPVREIFGQVCSLMKTHIGRKNIRLETSIEPENMELIADSELIEQVLINLLLNALQAIDKKKGSEIRLQGRLSPRGRVLLQVYDNGPGITKENMEKIFIPFFSTKEGGSGIGLSLSRQIMRLHRGTISVMSKPGKETVFTLRF